MNINLLCHGMRICTYIQSYIYNHVGVIPEMKGWFNIQKNINAIHNMNRQRRQIIQSYHSWKILSEHWELRGISSTWYRIVQKYYSLHHSEAIND